jgi:putative ABC transport system permease protein
MAAATPLLATQLFGISMLDPPTMTAVPVLLLLVAAVASYVPARRAIGIDPMEALRN